MRRGICLTVCMFFISGVQLMIISLGKRSEASKECVKSNGTEGLRFLKNLAPPVCCLACLLNGTFGMHA